MQADETVWVSDDDLSVTGEDQHKGLIASVGDKVEAALQQPDVPGDALEQSRLEHAAEDELARPADPAEFRASQQRLEQQ